MISFEQAERIARAVFTRGGWGQNYFLAEEMTAERPYGWEFSVRLKNPNDVRIGGCPGFIVERDDGAVFYLNTSPASLYEVEQEVRAFQMGFKSGWYDLVIQRVLNRDRMVDLLLSFDLTYIEPEEAFGRRWTIPKRFTREVMEARLRQPPCEFSVHRPSKAQKVTQLLDEANCCVYELRGRA